MRNTIAKILLICSTMILLGLFAWIPYKDASVHQSFWQNFWPNFWSDLIVAIIIAPLVVWLLSRTKRIEAKVIAAQGKVIASESPVDASTHRFDLSVKNTSAQPFGKEDVYWHVFVEEEFYFSHEVAARNTIQSDDIIVERGDKRLRHITGILEAPVFPHRYVKIVSVTARTPYDRQLDLYYFLSTPHGLFPKGLKLDENGEEVAETYGKIERHSLP